jgi:hypothetical protein
VIRIDDYVLNVNLEGIIDEERKKNIKFLRNHASLRNHCEGFSNLRSIDKLMRDVIEKTLK